MLCHDESLCINSFLQQYIMIKYTNGQSSQESSFLLSSQPQQPPNKPYAQGPPPPQPLLTYLFQEVLQIPNELPPSCDIPTPPPGSLGAAQASSLGLKEKKRRSIAQRVKTDVSQDEGWNMNLQALRGENKLLRRQLLEYQKKVANLETVQMQMEYLAKLSFLQQSEIEKLRRMLRQSNSLRTEGRTNYEESLYFGEVESEVNHNQSISVAKTKNKENCGHNSMQPSCKRSRKASFGKESSVHCKTISDWPAGDNSRASHSKKTIKRDGSRSVQKKAIFKF